MLSQRDPNLVAILYRAKHRDWTFPKGHVEPGEATSDTTRREVSEETGLPVRSVSGELPPLRYAHPSGDSIVLHMFLLQSTDDAKLKSEHAGDKVTWTDYREVAARLSYQNVKEYYLSIFDEVANSIERIRASTV